MLLSFSGLPAQCKPANYRELSEASRSVKKRTTVGYYYCDSLLAVGTRSPQWHGLQWYKVVNPAGTKIATRAIKDPYCGTSYKGYMLEPHPTEVGQTKWATFCFSGNVGASCVWKNYGKVTKCGEGNFVYNLPDVPVCDLRYCAEP